MHEDARHGIRLIANGLIDKVVIVIFGSAVDVGVQTNESLVADEGLA